MLTSDETGVADQDVAFAPNWLLGSQVTFWLTPRIGLRANMTYTDGALEAESTEIHGNVNLWSGTGDLMFRFREPNETWLGSEFLPYIALGLGGKWHNPAGDHFICNDQEEGKLWACIPFTVPPGQANAAAEFALGEQKVLAGLVGIGGDYRVSPNFAIRLELNDRIYKPQTYAADFDGGNIWDLPNGDENTSKVTHEIGAQVGLHFLLGLRQPEVVAVEPSPPPPPPARQEPLPPPTPTPEPPPPPREEEIMVCIIDPTANNGIRMESARFLVASGDTVVVRAGERIPLNQAVGQVATAQGQDWYVRGTPFVVTAGNYRAEFVTYGQASMRPPERVIYLGMVNGVPVYADADEAADVRTQIDQARAAQADQNLQAILQANANLRNEFDDLRNLYVPLRAVDCVFQPLQRQEPVRKGGVDAGMN